MNAPLLSVHAEAAIERLAFVLADFRAIADDRATAKSRRLSGSRVVVEPEMMAWPQLIAVVENFSLASLRRCVDRAVPAGNALVDRFRSVAEAGVDSSWAQQRAAWKNWFGIRYATSPNHADLLGFIDARNCVIHGLGYLTPKQKGDAGVRRRMEQSKLVFHGDRLVISTGDVERCATVCMRTVKWLDHEALAACK